MKVGTMVMLRAPAEEVAAFRDGAPRNGACGEVKDASQWVESLPVGTAIVDFPHNPSEVACKYWTVPVVWLIPLSDPDADVGENESIVKGKITEDLV